MRMPKENSARGKADGLLAGSQAPSGEGPVWAQLAELSGRPQLFP